MLNCNYKDIEFFNSFILEAYDMAIERKIKANKQYETSYNKIDFINYNISNNIKRIIKNIGGC